MVHQKILSNLSAIAIPSPLTPYLVSAHQSLSARDDLLPHIAKPIISTFSSSVFLREIGEKCSDSEMGRMSSSIDE